MATQDKNMSKQVAESPWLQPHEAEGAVQELVDYFHASGPSTASGDPHSGKSHFGSRLAKRIYAYQDLLRPLYRSYPKNSEGHMHLESVGQALHRAFVRRYQMHLKGSASFGEPGDGSSAAIFAEEFIQGFINAQLAHNGFTLRELAVLGVAMEHLIHEETQGILTKVFALFKMPLDTAMQEALVRKALDAYMVFLLARQDTGKAYVITEGELSEDQKRLKDLQDKLHTSNPYWKTHMKSLQDKAADSPGGLTTFSSALIVAEEFEEGLGEVHQREFCESRQWDILSAMSEAGTTYDEDGRIPLSLLQSKGFSESQEFLRNHGILDDSPANDEKVFIANWMLGPQNCDAKTDFYTVCCTDFCETILSRIEDELAAPKAHRSRIESIVSELSTRYVKAPRTLSTEVLAHLGDAAEVDIHSIFFADFLHHAFPFECPSVSPVSVHADGGQTANIRMSGASAASSDLGTSTSQLPASAVSEQQIAELAKSTADEPESVNGSYLYGYCFFLWIPVLALVWLARFHRHDKLKKSLKRRSCNAKDLAEMDDLKGIV